MADIQYITNTTLIKQVGNIEKVDTATKISPLMPLGRRDVIKIVGQIKYDEIRAKEEGDADKHIFALAESYFCLCYILPTISKVSSGSGLVKSTGYKDSKVSMMSEAEIQQVISGYKSTAESLLSDWKLNKDSDSDDNPDSCIAGHTKMIAV